MLTNVGQRPVYTWLLFVLRLSFLFFLFFVFCMHIDIIPIANHVVVALQMTDKVKYQSYTVSNVMKRRMSLKPAEINNLEADVRKALDYLHARRIQHGSVSEDSVLIDKVKWLHNTNNLSRVSCVWDSSGEGPNICAEDLSVQSNA